MRMKSAEYLTAMVLCCAVGTACKPKSTSQAVDASDQMPTTMTSAATTKTLAPKLPPDPPPRIPALASEVPKLEGEIAGDPKYATLFDDKHQDDRDLVLTAVSELLITEEIGNEQVFIPESVAKELERRKLMNIVLKVGAVIPRTGALPQDFEAKAKGAMASNASAERLGLWKPKKNGTPPVDYGGLAYWLNPSNAMYMREFIAARRGGAIGWENAAKPVRPYLVRERAALERLALLTTLTSDEAARLADLKASKLGDAPPDEVDLAKLLSEYGSNEIRADDAYKGHVVEFTGVAGALERGTIGGITLTVGTGKPFERPQVHCFFEKSETEKVKALNKGDRVRVRGKVDGLMVNVIVRFCQLVD